MSKSITYVGIRMGWAGVDSYKEHWTRSLQTGSENLSHPHTYSDFGQGSSLARCLQPGYVEVSMRWMKVCFMDCKAQCMDIVTYFTL